MLKAILQVAGEKNVRNQYCMSHSHLVLMIFLSLYLPTVQALAHFQQIASHSSVFIYLCFVFVLPSICISNAGALLPLLPRSWATLFISFFGESQGPSSAIRYRPYPLDKATPPFIVHYAALFDDAALQLPWQLSSAMPFLH